MEEIKHKVIQARYWNVNDIAITIVASITEGVDWAAYIGGGSGEIAEHEKNAVEWTLKYGAKLWERDARYFFGNIDLPYRG